MQIQKLTRQFRYNGAKLADPSPAFSLQQVRDFYANTYPEIVNAEIEGPELQGDLQVYTFRRAVGTKGAGLNQTDIRRLIESGSFCKRSAQHVPASALNLPASRELAQMCLSRRMQPALALVPTAASLPLLP